MTQATTTVPKLLWTPEETAAALGITEDGVRNLHRVGKLPGFVVGRHLRFRPDDVHVFVANLGSDE